MSAATAPEAKMSGPDKPSHHSNEMIQTNNGYSAMDDMEELISRLSLFKKPNLENVGEVTSAEYYYDPQSHLSTHEQIVNDTDTLETFREWIEENPHIIKNKVVLDVGCGTGIFSLMAARAGAARVISVEWSNIVEFTKKIVKENHYENVITVLKGKIERIKLPAGIEKVDVIISFWMGFSLIHGSRVKSVLYARDKFLKPDGYIIPDRASLYISGISDDEFRENHVDWWKNVYGHDMSFLTDSVLAYAVQSVVPPNKLCTNKCELKSFNLKTDVYEDIIKETAFQLTAKWNDYLQGFCTYFCVKFSGDIKRRELNTDPLLLPRMWGQTIFYFKDFLMIKKKEKLKGSLSFFHLNDDKRFLGVIIGVRFEGEMSQTTCVKEFIITH